MIAEPRGGRLTAPLIEGEDCLIGKFQAMGCPCEIILDTLDPAAGRALLETAIAEASRIEAKFSRYRPESELARINASRGGRVELDDETAGLLDFARTGYEMSGGLFDVTTGVLRKAASPRDRAALLPFVGWEKLSWARPFLRVPEGMEIDLGGVCKEYATDRILSLLTRQSQASVLVNLGGDISAAGRRLWAVGIEDVDCPGAVAHTVKIDRMALATSGNTKRDGHILDPRSGRPVDNPPRSVTVAAGTCTEAGFLSTLAMLHGSGAEAFLRGQDVRFWCYR